MILSPAPKTTLQQSLNLPELTVNGWHPAMRAQLEELPYGVCPYVCSTLEHVKIVASFYPENTIVFAPALGDKVPADYTTKLKIFSNCPRQFDVFVMPYMLPDYDVSNFDTGHWRYKDRVDMFSFVGSLRANTWRTVMVNSILSSSLKAQFNLIPTYFHACDDLITVLTLNTDHLSYPCSVLRKQELVEFYWSTLLSSKYTLCPIGDHHGSQRLVEAAYAGSIPILIGDPQMTSVPACIRHLVFALPTLVTIPAQSDPNANGNALRPGVYDYRLTTEQLYFSDDPALLEPHVQASWVYNPDPHATMNLSWLTDPWCSRSITHDLIYSPAWNPSKPLTLPPLNAYHHADGTYLPGKRPSMDPYCRADMLHWTRIGQYIEYELKYRMASSPYAFTNSATMHARASEQPDPSSSSEHSDDHLNAPFPFG